MARFGRTRKPGKQKVLILGGGYVGLYVAWGLEKHAELPLEVTVVEPRAYMTYQPLLPEVAGGHVDPRNVTVDLRQSLQHTDGGRGHATGLDTTARTATVETATGETRTLEWDHVVLAMGAVTRTFPTPGLAEVGVGFKTVEEAVYVRNRLLVNLARAAQTTDPAERRKYLTTVFVGGGYTGVEAITELLDLAKAAVAAYPDLDEQDLSFVLVEALDRVAPEVGPELSKRTLEQIRERGVDVRLKTTMPSCEGGHVTLSDGTELDTALLVWTAGVKPNPILDGMDVPRGPKGHVNGAPSLQVVREDGSWVQGVWTAGDISQVPDLTKPQPAYYPPNAQNAVRQATQLAENIARSIRGGKPREYKHFSLGTVAEYGPLKGAANIHGIQFSGPLAWLAHRSYHLYAMPTMDRRVRIVAGWIADAVGKPDLTPTDDTEDPQKDFAEAVRAA